MKVDTDNGLLVVGSGGSVLIYDVVNLDSPLYTLGVMLAIDASRKVVGVTGDNSALVDNSSNPPFVLDSYDADFCLGRISGSVFGLVWDGNSVIRLSDITDTRNPVDITSTPANSGPIVTAPVMYGSYIAIGIQGNYPNVGNAVYLVNVPLPTPSPPDSGSGLPTHTIIIIIAGAGVSGIGIFAALVFVILKKSRTLPESRPLNAAGNPQEESPPMYTP